MKKSILFLCLVYCSHILIAQHTIQHVSSLKNTTHFQNIKRCFTHEKYLERLQENPSIAEQQLLMEKQIQKWIVNQKSNKSQSVITIPVVVHVVYRTTDQNISDAQIQSQIDVLNKDFRRLNSDTANTPSDFKPHAADAGIEFCLASIDPDGNPTTGITRTQTTVVDIGNTFQYYYTANGGHDIWDPNSYMNIWICEISQGALGYTYLPGTAGPDYDGIVIQPQYFGTIGTVSSPYHFGRTMTHEVGHWLNLSHIWGDDLGSCSGTDNVNDTPNQAEETVGCPSFPLLDGCTWNIPTGVMFMNYMDYTNDSCMNMFTNDQASRMLSAISLYRPGLLSSIGCMDTSTLFATFSSNTSSTFIGDAVDFTDKSFGPPTSWEWNFSGGSPSSSTSQHPTNITYNKAGSYDVTLIVSDGVNKDTLTKKNYIIVYETSTVCDTLTNVPETSTAHTHVTTNAGYMSGHNPYLHISKADYFYDFPSNAALTKALLKFTVAEYGSSSSIVTVNVWDNEGSSKEPLNIIGSKDILIKDIATDIQNGDFTEVEFDYPVPINDAFYIGVSFYYNTSDTVVIATTGIGEVVINTAWTQTYAHNWYIYNDIYSLSMAHFIYPIFCGTTSSIYNLKSNQSLYVNVYPNPFKEEFEIDILNEKENLTENIQLSIYNMLGEKIKEQEIKANGSHAKQTVSIADFSNGIYYLHFMNGEQKVITKLIKAE